MNQHSLRFRLLAGAVFWVAFTLLLTGVALLFLFQANVERATRATLEASLDRLVAVMVPQTDATTLREPLSDPRYSLPYGGLYWQIEEVGGSVVARSRSLWDFVLETSTRGTARGGELTTLAGPEDQLLAALSRQVDFEAAQGGGAYLVTLAEDRSILDQTIREFGGDMALALLVLGLAILAAAWFVIHMGLTPLNEVRRGVEAVRRGARDKLADHYPTEVLPLVGEVNELLALRDKSVEFARARAADLAHGLKTPLQVLTATADKLREGGDTRNAATLGQIAAEMADRIDYQLRLARLRVRSGTHVLSASLNNAISRSVSVIKQTREGEALAWNVSLGEDVGVDIDRHDLLELVGVLVENAAKWAASRVDIAAHRGDGHAVLTIDDDGPGLGEDEIAKLGRRGQRLDESRQGSGLGLAIAMEILALNDGEAKLERSGLGGLSVRLRLPAAGIGQEGGEAAP